MFVGELEFNDNIVENTNEHKANFLFYGTHVYFITFLFLVGIVGLNFLTSVAIGETRDICQQSKMYSYKSMAELVCYFEKLSNHFPFTKLPKVFKEKLYKQTTGKS